MVCVVRNSRLKLNQGQIFWRETGQGQAIAFIHRECSDGSQWSDLLDTLSREYHCFAPDLIGFGDSEHPNIPYSIQWQSETLEAFFDNLRLKDIYLVGDALGAWIAARYALNYPERIKGLILLSPIGVDSKQNPSYFLEKLLVFPLPLVPWLLKGIAPVAGLFGLKTKLQKLLDYRSQLRQSPATCRLLFQRGDRQIRSEYLNPELPHLTLPTLILSDAKDHPHRLHQAELYSKLIKQAEHKTLDNEAEAIALLQTWMQQHSTSAAL